MRCCDACVIASLAMLIAMFVTAPIRAADKPTSAPSSQPSGSPTTRPTQIANSWEELLQAYAFAHQSFRGTVKSVTQTSVTVSLERGRGDMLIKTFACDEKTKVLVAVPTQAPRNKTITGNARVVKFDYGGARDVRQGRQVTVAYDADGRAVVIEIELSGSVAGVTVVVGYPPMEPTPVPARTPSSDQPPATTRPA